MRAVVAFIAGLVVVFSLGATLRAGEVPKPKGVCSGSYFQQYLEKRGVKAFAYAEDSSGRYTCGYSYRSDSGDRARTGALINCGDHATETGVTGKCQIVAKGIVPLWDERQTARASNRTTARDAWNYIKDRSVVRYFEAFLQSHPDSEFAPLARSRLAALGGRQTNTEARPRSARDAWNYIKDRSVVRYFEAFLQSHPDSEFAPLARSRLAALGGRQTNTEARPRTARDAWDFIKDRSVVRFFEDFLQAYPNSGLAPLARSRLAALRGETVVLAADTTAPVIDTPLRIDTDQAVIDVAGRVADESDVVELTLNRRAIALGSGNRFRVQRAVPVGTSELRIAALDEWGNRAEKRVVINRTAAAAPAGGSPAPGH